MTQLHDQQQANPGFKSYQFDPSISPYPEEWGAWCHGPGAYYAATPRGSIPLGQKDWIIAYENGDRIVVRNDTYNNYFGGQKSQPSEADKLIEESEHVSQLLSQKAEHGEPKPNEPKPYEPKEDEPRPYEQGHEEPEPKDPAAKGKSAKSR